MRMTAFVAAIASCTVVFSVQSAHADALSPAEIASEQSSPTLIKQIAFAHEEQQQEAIRVEEEKEDKQPTVHAVAENETLIKIAKDYDVSWQRIFYKNVELENPDVLAIGQELTIPTKEEELAERAIPEPTPVVVERTVEPARLESTRSTNSSQSSSRTNQAAPRASVPGNNYAYGYCTWYVKNLRPDLPNNLGNADTWASRAAAQGYATGSAPRVGAVAQALTGYMHVAYVSAVHGDGTITVREMNFTGWNQASSRRVAATAFTYIY